jgi:hypothetical protein
LLSLEPLADRVVLDNTFSVTTLGDAASALDPKLGPLGNNGGPTFTQAPAGGSPAIGAGDPRLTGTDQVGKPRAIHGRVDVGAFEVQANALLDLAITGLPRVSRRARPGTVPRTSTRAMS